MRRLNAVNRKQALKVVKEFDAFPKVPDNFKETTATGGGISIVTFLLIFILVISELKYYSETHLKFDYEVDTAIDGKIRLNIDMTVAMKCDHIGADVLDLTGQDTNSFGKLEMSPTHFEMSPRQKQYWEMVKSINSYLQEEYHAIQELLWTAGQSMVFQKGMPERDDQPPGPPNACRVHGSLEVNKVAGNFHITAGKSVPVFPRGHAHIAMMVHETEYNFSHRIEHFSFGEPVGGIVSPLDGEELITQQNYHMFQYFMQIVPTEVRTYSSHVDTYQFAVTEQNRSIDHGSGSHGVPGIFVKYDLTSLKIRVREEHRPYWQFLIRMIGIIGGIFSVSGMCNAVSGAVVHVLCCRFRADTYSTLDNQKSSKSDTSMQHPPLAQGLLSADTSLPPPVGLVTSSDS